MFLALILQNLYKLVERKIRDFPSPQAFHTVKIQGFNGDCVKRLTKVACELPMKVFALVTYFPIQACDLSHTSPPAVRTLLLTTEFFVERPKFIQVRFQRLWVLFLLTRAECQVRVFHTQVCPNALTCCRQRSKIRVGRCDTKPIASATITLDCDMFDTPVPLAVLVERISHFIKLPLTRLGIPLTKSQRDTIIEQRPTCLFKCEGLELMTFLDFRFTAKFLEKTNIRSVNPSKFLLYRLTRQGVPMRMCGAFQIRQVCRHSMIVRIRQPISISFVLPLMEVFMRLPHIVKQIAKPNAIGLIVKRIFIGFHGISHITPLSPAKWDGRHIVKRQCLACLPV